ncbi:DUF4870 domain-containing protein [Natronocalculus amylovorans]|uniref:DUF4870 domain-containing protein n=1 Tax=Natronocalculus amylovorans TaxID=2917812 RepID=A0AAE3FZ11_9EURY|nr:DUF4870 domain-containing protein [Natronocalculus amylovorans]MCL9818003.1 DUF4870 domain-containing protein [Natronocalculus amylovorans]
MSAEIQQQTAEQETTESSTGLDSNVAGALAYLLGPLTGIIFYVIEEDDRFVKFHAAQSIVFLGGLVILSIVLSTLLTVLTLVPVIGWIISAVIGLIGLLFAPIMLVVWAFLMYKAYQGAEYSIPVVGAFARSRMVE